MRSRSIQPMVNRKYLVTVRNTLGEYEFVERTGDNKDVVYGNACVEFGYGNVGGVYVNDSAGVSLERLMVRGIKRRQERCAG